jgi:4-hydroxybenzoate polyprenyltransferase
VPTLGAGNAATFRLAVTESLPIAPATAPTADPDGHAEVTSDPTVTPARPVPPLARRLASMVKLSHTIFGLPFTLAAALLVHEIEATAGRTGLDGWRILWIVVAFTGARSAAMGFNRIVDRDIDADNPRTADREIPSGQVSVPAAWVFVLASAAVFLGAAAMLGRWPLLLSPICLLVVFAYSGMKRVSWAAHLVLGLALALGPGGAAVAVTGDLSGWFVALPLMLAVATWVAGFDVLYSLQDEPFDRARGLHSIPVRLGTLGAVIASALLHVVTIAALVALHVALGLGPAHAIGVTFVSGLLVYEHWLVGPGDLSKIDRAFFDLNGYVSLVYLACVTIDVFAAG